MRTIDEFNTGCWARVIRRPEDEIQILRKREKQTASKLMGHDHLGKPDYTDYSSCTYIQNGLSINLFMWGSIINGDYFALLIQPTGRPIDWWYNGRREVVTDDIPPITGTKYNNGADESDQLWDCSLDQIRNAVLSLKDEYARDVYYRSYPEETVTLRWNEGFLRYQRDNIMGLLVHPTCKKSIESALAFRKALNINVDLYEYNADRGTCKKLHNQKIMRAQQTTQQKPFRISTQPHQHHNYHACTKFRPGAANNTRFFKITDDRDGLLHNPRMRATGECKI